MVQIIDASVAINWFLIHSDFHQKSITVLEKVLRNPTEFAVPELFYFELSHVLNKLINLQPRLPKTSSVTQQELIDSLLTIGIHRFSMTKELMHEINFFQLKGLSGYDAAYIGLAKILKGNWLTFDQKAHQKIEHLGLSKLL